MNHHTNIAQTAVILAGGQSSRMGRDKAFLQFNGKSLVQVLVDEFTPLFESIIVSAAGHNKNQTWPVNATVVIDEEDAQGPMQGIIQAFRMVKTSWVFVVSVDAPSVDANTVLSLWQHCKGNQSVVATHKSKIMPLIGWYKTDSLTAWEEAYTNGERRIMPVVNKMNPLFVELPANGLYNINTPNAYNSLVNEN